MISFFDLFLHIDQHLMNFIASYGTWTYLILFAVIFCETGLVLTPFLPGDSLLFSLGAFSALPNNPMQISVLLFLLIIACILGNQVNYSIGRWVGPKIFKKEHVRFFNKQHLNRAHQFYQKNGGKAVVMGRFLPIIRTFVPFVAGISSMSYTRFSFYNIASGFLWVGSLLAAGYFLGSIPFVSQHFSLAIYGIIIVSLIPSLFLFASKKAVNGTGVKL